jgi:hypothetical protein
MRGAYTRKSSDVVIEECSELRPLLVGGVGHLRSSRMTKHEALRPNTVR